MQTPPPALDLVNKGVYRVDFSIVDFDSRISGKPMKVYFAELASADEFKSERIIASERVDSDGMIYVNLTPGIYGVIAAERYLNTGDGRGLCQVYTLFNNELISRSVVKVEKGQTQIQKFRVLGLSDTMFDKTPESVKYYNRVICKKMSPIARVEIGKFIDSPESIKKMKEETKQAEKVGSKIENY